jgi:hypothetical protein
MCSEKPWSDALDSVLDVISDPVVRVVEGIVSAALRQQLGL